MTHSFIHIKYSNMKYLIGIDEAGRGSWAWPVTAGIFAIPLGFDFDVLPFLTDSKKLTSLKREILYEWIERLSKEGKCYFAAASSPAEVIDSVGIREANRLAMQQCIEKILERVPLDCIESILIDGRDNYHFDGIDPSRVQFIIRWDLLEKVISAASIVAKVTRDRMMRDFHTFFPDYGFYLHKGYGTKKHHEALLYHGISSIHRKSYAPVKALISKDS